MKGVILLVFDGLGIALPGPGNAYLQAHPQHFESLKAQYPNTQLRASGEAVGLPANEVGSTEVGHINMGAGKIVYQSLPRINLSIADGTFFQNEAFVRAIDHAQKNNGTLHLMGLLGNGTVHASTAHLFALLFMCKERKINNVALHVITDGRDSPPKAALTYLEEVQQKLDQIQVGHIATVMGRYYAMDRDHRWERIEKAYRCLTDPTQGARFSSWKDLVDQSYQNDKSDEFIEPSHIVAEGQEPTVIKKGDSVIFYNFRIDRPRELTKAFVLENFETEANKSSFDPYAVKYEQKHIQDEAKKGTPFQRGPKIPDLHFVMMTEYEKGLPADLAFAPSIVNMPLGRILSENGIPQLRMAESEKERFVTHYFNGLRSAPFPMEDRIIVPSPKVPTYDQKPEMSAYELTEKLVQKINEGNHRFILVNYANADMVGHTGNFDAAVKAVQAIDQCVAKVVEAALNSDYAVLITADHGNVEEMVSQSTGGKSTEHSGNPIPFIAVAKEFQGKGRQLQSGIMADIAPTVLGLLNIPVPHTMTGRNLLQGIGK